MDGNRRIIMKIKYNKILRKNRKIIVYIIVGGTFIACNIFTLIDSLANQGGIERWRIVALFSSFIIECIGFLYCLVQDITNSIRTFPAKFIFTHDSNGIPFVDRKELLENIVQECEKKLLENYMYYTKNIRYGERNGKTAFAKRLCYEFQKIKDKDENSIRVSCPKFPSKIGNIFYVNYSNYADSFSSRIKTEFTFVKGKKNIVVVDNSYEDLCLWTDNLADKDVFFIFLNFNINSEDALFFADDKIKELLIQLQKSPAFCSITKGKTEEEICSIATKLGNISNNNIGTIIDLLSSNEFSILLETDRHFLDFYFAIKHGRYSEAQNLYNQIVIQPSNKVLKYKLQYEHANLVHFLGKYSVAFEELNILLALVCNDQQFLNTMPGESLYTDIILLQAHIEKHRGNFDSAASILTNVFDEHQNIQWLRSHFSINILQLNEFIQPTSDWRILLGKLDLKMSTFKEKRKLKNSDYYFYETYYPIVCFYKSNFDKKIISELIKIENTAILYYEKEERRYLTNCYFIKAELFRINRDWKNAEEFYNRCYNIFCHNGDKDILYLVAITCKYLQCLEKIILNIPFDWDAAIEECKQCEGYNFHNRLISKLELANVDMELKKYLEQHYCVTINPIP